MISLKKYIIAILLFFTCSLFLTLNASAEQSSKLSILDSFSIKNNIYANISVNGLVSQGANVDVLVYIDGTYTGLANISQGSLSTSVFTFTGSSLYKDTPYEILVFTRNKTTGMFSEPVFSYDRKVAPTFDDQNTPVVEEQKKQATNTNTTTDKDDIDADILPPTLSSITTNTQNNILVLKTIGFTKNKTSVYFYLDDVYAGKTKELTDEKGTVNFEYTIIQDLKRGEHNISAIAINSQGKQSAPSNVLSFNILIPQITNSATESTYSTSPETKSAPQNKDTSEIDAKSAKKTTKETPTTVSNNEINTSNSAFRLNLIIFVFFLFAIIVWIFLINKELTKDVPELKDHNIK